MNKNNIYNLEDRGILYLNGDDVVQFLQNIISNDMNKINNQQSCFTSLLSPQGKYLFDFIIIKHKNGFIIDCEKKQIDELYKLFKLYKLRSKVEILNLSNEFVVAALSREKFLSIENAKDETGYTVRFREDPLFLDPRDKFLGARLIINLEKLYLSIKKLNLTTSDYQDYYYHSYQLGIPQINTEKLKNKVFGIECNFEELNGIDFKKGCYIGQENTSRIKLRDKLIKRVFPVKVCEGSISVNDEIKFNNENLGKILIDDKFPFALVKFKNKNFHFEKEYHLKSGKIKILKPNWLKSNNSSF